MGELKESNEKINCGKVEEMMPLFLDSEPSYDIFHEDKKNFDEHISSCDNCRNKFNSLTDIVKMTKDLPELDLPDGFHAESMALIKKHRKGSKFDFKKFSTIAAAVVFSLFVVSSCITGLGQLNFESSKAAHDGKDLGSEIFEMEVSNVNANEETSVSLNKEMLGNGRALTITMRDSDTAQNSAQYATIMGEMLENSIIAESSAFVEEKNVIRYNITVEVDNITETLDKISTLSGNIVKSDIFLNNENNKRADIVYSVDSIDYYGTIYSLQQLGEVISENQSQHSVLINAKDDYSYYMVKFDERNRLLELLKKADTVESMLMIEERLSSVVEDLEYHRTRINTWNDESDNPTITITLREKPKLIEKEEKPFGQRTASSFNGSIKVLKNLSADFMVLFSAAILPILIISVILLIVVFLVKKSERKR